MEYKKSLPPEKCPQPPIQQKTTIQNMKSKICSLKATSKNCFSGRASSARRTERRERFCEPFEKSQYYQKLLVINNFWNISDNFFQFISFACET